MSYPPAPRVPDMIPARRPDHRQRTTVIIVVALVVALLGLGALGAYLIANRPPTPVAPTTTDPTGTPAGVVEAYLNALAAGDATTALTYSATQPEDTTFMTNTVLSASMTSHPITNIDVPAGQTTETPATITATYKLDGTYVNASFTVQKHGTVWLLDGGFLTMDIGGLTRKGVGLTLNGIDLKFATTVDLFPGVYTFAPLDPMLSVEHGSFTIAYPEAQPTVTGIGFGLSDKATTAIIAAAQAKMDWCLAQQVIQPEGCGFAVQEDPADPVAPTSIKWKIDTGDKAIAGMKPVLDTGAGPGYTHASAPVAMTFLFSGHSSSGLHLYTDISSAISQMRADFSDPGHIIVTFG